MKHTLKLVAAGLVVVGASFVARPASATPATLGFYPSSDIYGKGNVHYDADTYQSTNFKTGVVTTSGLTYGVGPDTDKLFGRTEVGFDYNFGSPGSLQFSKRISGNIKTQLYNDDAKGIRVVAGGWGLGDSNFNPNYVYLLASKNFEKFGRVHLGVAQGLSDSYFGSSDQTSVHVAYDRSITTKLSFCADYYSGNGPASGVQPTFYYYPNDKCDFGLGYFRANSGAANPRNQFYICFDYNFDFKGSTPAPAPTP
ncbi:hypothetical protein EON83_19980 [bacterium]|nr:MAG: hypothetical protein EON83_19980 [bacterium]